MTTKFRQKCQDCSYFTSVQDMETFFARKIGFSGIANSNIMLSEYFREQIRQKMNQNWNKLGHNFGPKQTTIGICVQRTWWGH